MKVLFVTENLMEGGTQLFMLRLAEALIEKGIHAKILLLHPEFENSQMTGAFRTVPIVRLQLPFQKQLRKLDQILFSIRSDFSFVASLQKRIIVKRYAKEYDILHTHYPKADYLVCRVKKSFPSARHIVTAHGDYPAAYDHFQKHKRGLWNRLDDKLLALKENVDQWVVISEEQKKFFAENLGIPESMLQKIYNGLQKNKSNANKKQPSENEFIIGMVARGVEEKGWQVMVDAFLKLPANCRLLLVGDGPFLKTLKAKHEHTEGMTFVGYVPDATRIMQDCDVIALPSHSRQESLPYAIIEALSCGKPVVASDVGEIKRMLTDEATGDVAGAVLPLINGKVQADDLLQALTTFYKDRDLLQAKGIIAKKVFEKFEMETCVNQYLSLYQREMASTITLEEK